MGKVKKNKMNGNTKKGKEQSQFNFAGGDKLNSMGAAWFAGFCYALFVDPTYTKWIYGKPNGLAKNRLETYEEIAKKRVRDFDDFDEKRDGMNVGDKFIIEFWLKKILSMEKLDKSLIDEKPETIKEYVRQILSFLDKYVFEGIVSEISTDGQKFFFKLKGTDGFCTKRKKEDGEKDEKFNLFISNDYSTARLLPESQDFSIGKSNCMRVLLISANNAQKKIRIELSKIEFEKTIKEKKNDLEKTICLVKIL